MAVRWKASATEILTCLKYLLKVEISDRLQQMVPMVEALGLSLVYFISYHQSNKYFSIIILKDHSSSNIQSDSSYKTGPLMLQGLPNEPMKIRIIYN